MRALDCKEPGCQAELSDAPVMLDCLCDHCREHFEKLQELLALAKVHFTVDSRIVRGLDYYTKTVFEVTTEMADSVLTVCGGGRYDGLMQELGGPDIPAVGFGMGMERVLMLMEQLSEEERLLREQTEAPEVFVACLNKSLVPNAFVLLEDFREAGLRADMDHQWRSLKAQFKYADKLGTQYVAVLGEDEMAKGVVKLRDMSTREEWEVPLTAAPGVLTKRIMEQAGEKEHE